MRIRLSKKTLVVISMVSVPFVVSAGTYLQPWKLFTDTRVEEALPQLTETTVAPKEATPDKADEKGGQWEGTVNPPAQLSKVQILHPPRV